MTDAACLASTSFSLWIQKTFNTAEPKYGKRNYINRLGLDALYVVLSFLVGGLTFLNTNGNLILELWNCLVLSLLQSFAGTVAVLMIWMHGNLTL